MASMKDHLKLQGMHKEILVDIEEGRTALAANKLITLAQSVFPMTVFLHYMVVSAALQSGDVERAMAVLVPLVESHDAHVARRAEAEASSLNN